MLEKNLFTLTEKPKLNFGISDSIKLNTEIKRVFFESTNFEDLFFGIMNWYFKVPKDEKKKASYLVLNMLKLKSYNFTLTASEPGGYFKFYPFEEIEGPEKLTEFFEQVRKNQIIVYLEKIHNVEMKNFNIKKNLKEENKKVD